MDQEDRGQPLKRHPASLKIACVVLAGGQGTRIGGDKPQRQLGGASLLARALDQARQWSGDIAVAVRDARQLEGHIATALIDNPAIPGPAAGLDSALVFARERGAGAVLTIAADMPFLPRDLCTRLTAGIGDATAAMASSGGQLHPVCALWRVATIKAVSGYLGGGRRSLKGLAETVGYVTVDWPTEPVDPFFNVNTSRDLAEAERLLKG